MPKIKTHKGAAKRFRLTKNGKLIRRRQGGGHLRRKKPKRMRSLFRRNVTSTSGSLIKLFKQIAPAAATGTAKADVATANEE